MSAPSTHAATFRKRLDEDCLLGGELHPSIAERLARVRELPVSSVANLYGVERDDAGVWLVWQYIEGKTLEQFMSAQHTSGELQSVSRDLNLAVASIHAHGIVHGAIHERNVIIDPHGRLRLTHVSPLLYSDPTVDERAVAQIVARLLPKQEGDSDVGRDQSTAERRYRFIAYLSAVAALLAGALMFAAILWYISN